MKKTDLFPYCVFEEIEGPGKTWVVLEILTDRVTLEVLEDRKAFLSEKPVLESVFQLSWNNFEYNFGDQGQCEVQVIRNLHKALVRVPERLRTIIADQYFLTNPTLYGPIYLYYLDKLVSINRQRLHLTECKREYARKKYSASKVVPRNI